MIRNPFVERILVPVAAALAGVLFARFEPVDRRIVDTVFAGNVESEYDHGYAGYDATSGTTNDTTYRETRGWMRYSMTTFDDTEVTVYAMFTSGSSHAPEFDLVVEDSVIATYKIPQFTPGTARWIVETRVPFGITKGRTSIAVTIRARGGTVPQLRQLRTLQDHHEYDLAHSPANAAHSENIPVSHSFSRSHKPLGVAR